MQNRNAIILSMGMLLEKVDTSGFIFKLLKKAKEENAEFVFTAELQKQAFILSETFNLGKISPEKFNTQLLQMLGIKTMTSVEFWAEWESMIIPGNMNEKIKLLQDVNDHHHTLMYLASDTNIVHLDKIAEESSKQKIFLGLGTPMRLGQFPLYASCELGKSRMELIKHIVGEIQAKASNQKDGITIILGNPENVKDPVQKQMAQRELAAISVWCKENGVSIQLHNNSLKDTLAQMFPAEITAEQFYNFGC